MYTCMQSDEKKYFFDIFVIIIRIISSWHTYICVFYGRTKELIFFLAPFEFKIGVWHLWRLFFTENRKHALELNSPEIWYNNVAMSYIFQKSSFTYMYIYGCMRVWIPVRVHTIHQVGIKANESPFWWVTNGRMVKGTKTSCQAIVAVPGSNL